MEAINSTFRTKGPGRFKKEKSMSVSRRKTSAIYSTHLLGYNLKCENVAVKC